MPRMFELSIDSPVRVEEILAAFGDEEYWQARLAAFDSGTARLASLSVDADAVVSVDLTVSLLANRLPKLITTLAGGDLAMTRTETWYPTGDGHAHGEIEVAVPGAPVSAIGEVVLAHVARGSRLKFSTTVQVKVPLVGGQIEDFIIGRLASEIGTVQGFTDRWIAANR
jgi:Protein of unknown function (DUF2505)